MATSHYCARCLTTFYEDPPSCPNLACGTARPAAGWGVLLGPGDTLDRHYRIQKPLAVGGAGLTYLARELDADGNAVEPDLAIKVLYTQRDSGPFLRRLANEAQILQELAHDHIVQCRGFVQRAGQAPYLVTLFEHGGSLADHVERLGTLPAGVAAGILRQILLALDVAHQRGVVHRDLKPDNVLLAAPTARDVVPYCRVADFGIAKIEGGVGNRLTRLGAFVGTPEFAAPEQFEGLAPTPATDVFAAGAVLFHLLTGRPPVQFTQRHDIEESHAELLKSIPPKLPLVHADPQVQSLLQDVVDNTMQPHSGDRWTVHQILSRLAPIAEAPDRTPYIRTPTAGDKTSTQSLQRGEVTFDVRNAVTMDNRTLPTVDIGTGTPQVRVLRAPTEPIPADPPARSGVGGAIVGFGSMLLVSGASAAVAVLVILLSAWANGWLSSPEPADLQPIVVKAPR